MDKREQAKTLVEAAIRITSWYPTTLDEYDSIFHGMKAKDVIEWVKKNPEKAKKAFAAKGRYEAVLFPSGWDGEFGTPYPVELAKLLVASKAEESITDICNVYYAGRKLTPEAFKIFLDKVLSDKLPTGLDIVGYGGRGEVSLYEVNGLEGFIKAHPKAAAKVLLKIPKKSLELLDDESKKLFKKVTGADVVG